MGIMAAIVLAWIAERWVALDDLSLIFIVAVVVVAAGDARPSP